MGPTRKRDLMMALAGVAVLSYPVVEFTYRWFPPVTVWTGLSLLVAAVAEAVWGRYVRTKIDAGEVGFGRGRLHPLAAARSVPVAKASAWLGALVLGFWVGVLAYLLPRRAALHVAEQDTPGALIAAASALALLIAGLWLQNCCKSPQDPGDPADLAGNQSG